MRLVLISFALIPFLFSCRSQTIELEYNLPAPVDYELYHNGYYSTMQGDVEQVGTISETFTLVKFQQEGNAWTMERSFVADKSKGYHKNSLPQELAQRVSIRLVAEGSQVKSVSGYEKFESAVVDKLPITERFRNQLRGGQYATEFDRIEKRRWELSHLLPAGKYNYETNITPLLLEASKLKVSGIEIDSILTGTDERVEGRDCFRYTVHFRDREPFPYFLWEQHAFGLKEAAALQKMRPDSASYQVAYDVILDPETGVICKEREIRKGLHMLHDPVSDARGNFTSSIVIERIYRKPN